MDKIKLTKWSGLMLVVLSCVLVLTCASAALWRLATEVDRETRIREEEQVSHGVAGWIEEIQGRIAGQANWDDALLNLGAEFDPEWARSNVGQFLHDMVGLEHAFVLNADNRPVYAMTQGRDAAPHSFNYMARQADRLIAKVRLGEA